MTFHLYYLSSALDYNSMNHCNLTTVASKIRCVGLQEAENPTTSTRKPASVLITFCKHRDAVLNAHSCRSQLGHAHYSAAISGSRERRALLQVTTRPRTLLRRWLEQLLTHGPLWLGQRISSDSGSRNWPQLIGTLPR